MGFLHLLHSTTDKLKPVLTPLTSVPRSLYNLILAGVSKVRNAVRFNGTDLAPTTTVCRSSNDPSCPAVSEVDDAVTVEGGEKLKDYFWPKIARILKEYCLDSEGGEKIALILMNIVKYLADNGVIKLLKLFKAATYGVPIYKIVKDVLRDQPGSRSVHDNKKTLKEVLLKIGKMQEEIDRISCHVNTLLERIKVLESPDTNSFHMNSMGEMQDEMDIISSDRRIKVLESPTNSSHLDSIGEIQEEMDIISSDKRIKVRETTPTNSSHMDSMGEIQEEMDIISSHNKKLLERFKELESPTTNSFHITCMGELQDEMDCIASHIKILLERIKVLESPTANSFHINSMEVRRYHQSLVWARHIGFRRF